MKGKTEVFGIDVRSQVEAIAAALKTDDIRLAIEGERQFAYWATRRR